MNSDGTELFEQGRSVAGEPTRLGESLRGTRRLEIGEPDPDEPIVTVIDGTKA